MEQLLQIKKQRRGGIMKPIVIDLKQKEQDDYEQLISILDNVYEELKEKMTYELKDINTDDLINIYLQECRLEGIGYIYKERQVQDCNTCKNTLRKLFKIVLIEENEIKPFMKILYEKIPSDNVYKPIFKKIVNEIYKKIGLDNIKKLPYYEKTPREAGGFIHYYYRNDLFKTQNPERIIALYNYLQKINNINIDLDYLKDNLFRFNDFEYLFRDYLLLKDYTLYQLLDTEIPEYLTTSTSVATFLEKVATEDIDNAISFWNMAIDPERYMKQKEKELSEKEAERLLNDLLSKYDFDFRIADINDLTVSELIFVDRRLTKINNKTKQLLDIIKSDLKPDKIKLDIEKLPKKSFDDLLKELPDIEQLELFITDNSFPSAIIIADGDNIITKSKKYLITQSGAATAKNDILNEVKKHGGVVDAPFVCSLWWATGCDYDLHLLINNKYECYFSNKTITYENNTFKLDVDMNVSDANIPAVENIYSKNDTLPDGEYKLFIKNFTYRGRGKDKLIQVFLRIPGYGEMMLITKKQLKSKEILEICKFRIKNSKIVEIKINPEFKLNNNSEGYFKRITFIYNDEYLKNNLFIATDEDKEEIEFPPFAPEHLKTEIRHKYNKILNKISKNMKFRINKKSAVGYLLRKDNPFILKVKYNNNKQKIYLIS